jgi:hypothetical protein
VSGRRRPPETSARGWLSEMARPSALDVVVERPARLCPLTSVGESALRMIHSGWQQYLRAHLV